MRGRGEAGLTGAHRGVILANAAFIAAVLSVMVAFSSRGIEVGSLLRDPSAVLGLPLHVGLLSNVGVVIWAAGAGGLLLAGIALRALRRPDAALFLSVGGLTLVLAADDLLQFHDSVGMGPVWFGIPQEVIVGTYGLVAAVLLVLHRSRILRLEGRWVLLVAAFALATSVGIDVIDPDGIYIVYEDGAKIVGIFNWSVGWFLAAVGALREAVRSAAPPEARNRSADEREITT
jgi:hypothetical protein